MHSLHYKPIRNPYNLDYASRDHDMTCSATSLRDAEEWNLDFSLFSIIVPHRVQLCTYRPTDLLNESCVRLMVVAREDDRDADAVAALHTEKNNKLDKRTHLRHCYN